MTVQMLSPMGAHMLEMEAVEGRAPIYPDRKPDWLIAEDFWPWPVLSIDGSDLHIVVIASARRGAFTRLLARARQAGLTPVVVAPMGLMESILRRWGWVETVKGSGFDRREEWREPLSNAQQLGDAV